MRSSYFKKPYHPAAMSIGIGPRIAVKAHTPKPISIGILRI
jgi:hypothetical protein